MNSRFEKLLDSINGQEIMNHILLIEIHDQLLLLVRTINAAKNNEYLTESLDLDDVKEIGCHEINSLPIINIYIYIHLRDRFLGLINTCHVLIMVKV